MKRNINVKVGISKEQMIVNRLSSDLSNFRLDWINNDLDEYGFYSYIKDILNSADVDSKIIVEVLEKTHNSNGIEIARCIKVDEGW